MTKELTLTEFRTIIREEAMKLKRRLVLENEKKQLQKELDELLSESCVDEGYGRDFLNKVTLGAVDSTEGEEAKRIDDFKKDFESKINAWKNKGIKAPTNSEFDSIMSQATKDNHKGALRINKDKSIYYLPYSEFKKVSSGFGHSAPSGGLSLN